ncbi:MAG: peptide-methionine (S)-S-oxide reductase MsrA [Saprospiraceae bacterium]
MKQLIVISILSIFATLGCSQKNGGTPKMDNAKNPKIENYIKGKNYEKYSVATFAGGCFWCTEASFERINGVVDVISGYSGGHTDHPTYKEVCAETTGHAEAIQIYFDPAVITFDKLLDVFFVAHNPTQLNRQGNDIGESYRSAIFYQNEKQKEILDAKIKVLNESTFSGKIVTQVKAFDEFWVAEEYHQNFYEINPRQSYVYNVSRPKVEKVMKTFKDILKPKYKK